MSATASPPRPLMPVPDVAKWLYVSEKTVWRLLEKQALTRIKVGARTLITPESVEAYIAQGGDV